MTRITVLALLLFCTGTGLAQNEKDYFEEMRIHREALNAEFADPTTSPLTPEDLEEFTSLDFYPVDTGYRITARFVRTKGEKPFAMPTSTDRKPRYVKYGEAHFELNGKKHVLSIYKNLEIAGVEEYKDHLFLPFTDLTNGFGTYGGGRYLDLITPESDTIMIDFNKAYNPYCAYNYKYSCPIPPEENRLDAEIRAGARDFEEAGE